MALCRSGGLSHFVVEEQLDRRMMVSDLEDESANCFPCYRSEAGTGAGIGFVI